MAEKKLENLSRVQLLEALCVEGKNAESLAKEYEMDKRTVQEYLYEQGFTKNTIKRESLVLLRGTVYDEANIEAKEDLISHSASSITDALVIYLTGALSRAGKGEKPKQILQRALSPVINSLLREEWLKLLLFIENQPLPESILRFPADGYLNQLLQEYASHLPAGYDIKQDSSRMPKNDPVTIRNKKASNHKENPTENDKKEQPVEAAFVKEGTDAAPSDNPQMESPVTPDEHSKVEQDIPLPEQPLKEQACGTDHVPMVPPKMQGEAGGTPSINEPSEQPVMAPEKAIAPSLEKKDPLPVTKQIEASTVMHGKTKGFLSQEDTKDTRKRPIMGDALLKS